MSSQSEILASIRHSWKVSDPEFEIRSHVPVPQPLGGRACRGGNILIMVARFLAVAGTCALGLPSVVGAETGLLAASGGIEISRAAPHLFLDTGEGFTPRSRSAGIHWSGILSILRHGDYSFFPSAGSLRIDGVLLDESPVYLQAGSHRIELEQPRDLGPQVFALDWSGPGFAREPLPGRLLSHDALESDPIDGRELFEDLGCANCHGSDSPSIQKRPGPVLTGLGSRVKSMWILHWLDAPERFRTWATMPQLLSPSEREDVAAFLAEQRLPEIQEPRVRTEAERRGRTTFQSYGCVACHGTDLPLAGLGSKMTVGRLQEFLLDPLHFLPDGRMPSFHLNAGEALDLAAFLSLSRDERFETPVAGGDSVRGRELVLDRGCLACHELNDLEAPQDARALAVLNARDGCLADEVPSGLPRYRLQADQRDALRTFVASYRAAPDRVPAPTFDLPRRMRQLRCGACHEIDGKSASGAIAEAAPSLTGVGKKLTSEGIEQALKDGTRTLGWQELRMPSFGGAHARWFADALPKASGVIPQEGYDGPGTELSAEGLIRLGVDGSRGGMGCIGCHGWGEFPALGENGPDLLDVGRRLRWPWFERWMRDPARVVVGTSMPKYFGDPASHATRTAISELWAAFRSADQEIPPFGFGAEDARRGGESVPVPRNRAIVVRWDMPEATPAAIAVGLPGGISYCFDAGESRLRYAWRGGFVDLTRTLLTKKNRETNLTETAQIVGDVFFREGRYPLRVGAEDRIPQRRFLGYRLVDSVPEFHYLVDGVSVHERITPVEKGIARRFRLEDVRQAMRFVPAANEGVEIRSTLEGFEVPPAGLVEFEVTVVEKR